MKEINSISLERMNNGAHFLYVSDILAHAKSDEKVNERAASQVTTLQAAVAGEDEALKISQKSLLTDDIAAADSERDALYSGYKKAVQSFLAMPVEAMAKAARELNQHIKDYGIQPEMQMDRESGLLINFIADLEGKYAQQVTRLALSAFVTGLKAANEKVRTLTEARTNERMGITVGALKEARRASDEAYRMLVKMVNALALVEGEDNYTPFIDYVNTQIVHYKREVLGQTTDNAETGSSSSDSAGSSPASESSDNPIL